MLTQQPSRLEWERGCSKRPVQQGRRRFGERSVQEVREHDKGPRTPLADFFNSPIQDFAARLLSPDG
ncbi:MAG: hypothetical protein VST68_11680 [Nitrospirota bacterium]|nr:hypothetical protein [Nitrospirota bacterium]